MQHPFAGLTVASHSAIINSLPQTRNIKNQFIALCALHMQMKYAKLVPVHAAKQITKCIYIEKEEKDCKAK